MSRPLAELVREAMELPQPQRQTLARILLESSDTSSAGALSEDEKAWENEIAQRIRGIYAGKADDKPWDSVLADINKRFAW